MVAPATPVQLVRLSPSGPELGTPPSLIGGAGSLIEGRAWFAQGNGAGYIDVPNPVADVPSLDAVPVNMKPGYTYDVDVDTSLTGTNGLFNIVIAGSHDNGSTYQTLATLPQVQFKTGSGRVHKGNLTVANITDHLKVRMLTTNGASADCQYVPGLTALRVKEYSTS